METKYWDLNDTLYTESAISEAAELLLKGETVAFPTETVYGLGADATNQQAVSKIFEAKGRPQDNPLIAHVAAKEQLAGLVESTPGYVDKLIDQFTPGPLTFILPHNGKCAGNVTAGLSTIAIRIPDHPVARDLLTACRVPLAAPSANASGKPSPTTAQHVWADLNGKIAGILDGGATGVGLESTVLDCTGDIPVILRPGGVTKEELEKAAGKVLLDPGIMNEHGKPRSPGMKYRHYAPEVDLWLIEGTAEQIQEMIDKEKSHAKMIGVMAQTNVAAQLHADQVFDLGNQPEEIAAKLYDALRTFKEGDVDLIICEALPEKGIGQAIMNRLKKAAAKHIGV
ncbi:L-threonylcarbamoyladenylate synthase [Virgibacillus sp. YIM 98842]|uniref:L-threonylcarbamoyladenylate synthase n=1 Tax=Virgibacillus sp. YIM 98842 TaxID=2663533 RepID=UPI0013D9B8D5|nr:L-threonylcarbamoyladenylate synthase [Virgibacillus sp. YIM 98842]